MPPDAQEDNPSRGGGGRFGRGDLGFREPPPGEPPDPNRIQIDLGPVRREILQQLFPDRERWDQLSPQERTLILSKVNERMLGIQQGIQILQQTAAEKAADAKAAADAAKTLARSSETAPSTSAPRAAQPKPRPAPAPAPAAAPAPAPAPVPPPMQRRTAMAGSRMDVRVMQDGQVVGQVNADINLPNLLATVFTTTRRERGEVPFAVGKDGKLYTPTEDDRRKIESIGSGSVAARRPTKRATGSE